MKLKQHLLALCVIGAMSAAAFADGHTSPGPGVDDAVSLSGHAASPSCGAVGTDCVDIAAPPPAREHQSGALMLGGLGAIGFVAHRRRMRFGRG